MLQGSCNEVRDHGAEPIYVAEDDEPSSDEEESMTQPVETNAAEPNECQRIGSSGCRYYPGFWSGS